MRTRRRLRPALDRLDDRCLPSGLTPAQLTHAYGLDAITFTAPSGATVKGDGTGSTIALIEAYHDPTLPGDLQAFDQAYNLPDPPLDVVNLGGAKSNPAWSLEESLDVEWAHAIAPGATIVVVEAGSQSLQGLQAAVNIARNIPSVDVVSMSLGFPESTYHGSLTLSTPAGPYRDHVRGGQRRQRAGRRLGLAGRLAERAGRRRDDALRRRLGAIPLRGRLERQRRRPEPVRARARLSAGRRSRAGGGSPRTSPSTATPTPASRSTRPRPTPGWGRGRSSAARAWARPPGRRSSPSPTRAGPSQGKGSLDGASQTLPTLYALPSTDFHSVASNRAGHAGRDGPRLAQRPVPDRRPGGQQHRRPADHLRRQHVRLPGGPPPQGAEGRRAHHRAARRCTEVPVTQPAASARRRPPHTPSPARRSGSPTNGDR